MRAVLFLVLITISTTSFARVFYSTKRDNLKLKYFDGRRTRTLKTLYNSRLFLSDDGKNCYMFIKGSTFNCQVVKFGHRLASNEYGQGELVEVRFSPKTVKSIIVHMRKYMSKRKRRMISNSFLKSLLFTQMNFGNYSEDSLVKGKKFDHRYVGANQIDHIWSPKTIYLEFGANKKLKKVL